jgi:molybdenum cofactor cytidylyltransferase
MTTGSHSGRIGALVLAAGASERLGMPKQLLLGEDGLPLVSNVVHAAQRAGFDPVLVVVGAHAEEVTHALINDAAAVFLVPNRAWSEGMGSSIRAGVACMSTHGLMTDVEGVLIATCDMPTANDRHFASLRAAALTHGAVARAASRYTTRGGSAVTTGIPAIFPRSDWPALLALSGERGAKALCEEPDTVTVPLLDGSFDLDTPDDVSAWRASLHRDP